MEGISKPCEPKRILLNEMKKNYMEYVIRNNKNKLWRKIIKELNIQNKPYTVIPKYMSNANAMMIISRNRLDKYRRQVHMFLIFTKIIT